MWLRIGVADLSRETAVAFARLCLCGVKPVAPLLVSTCVGLKPWSPLRAGEVGQLKPLSPLRVRNGCF